MSRSFTGYLARDVKAVKSYAGVAPGMEDYVLDHDDLAVMDRQMVGTPFTAEHYDENKDDPTATKCVVIRVGTIRASRIIPVANGGRDWEITWDHDDGPPGSAQAEVAAWIDLGYTDSLSLTHREISNGSHRPQLKVEEVSAVQVPARAGSFITSGRIPIPDQLKVEKYKQQFVRASALHIERQTVIRASLVTLGIKVIRAALPPITPIAMEPPHRTIHIPGLGTQTAMPSVTDQMMSQMQAQGMRTDFGNHNPLGAPSMPPPLPPAPQQQQQQQQQPPQMTNLQSPAAPPATQSPPPSSPAQSPAEASAAAAEKKARDERGRFAHFEKKKKEDDAAAAAAATGQQPPPSSSSNTGTPAVPEDPTALMHRIIASEITGGNLSQVERMKLLEAAEADMARRRDTDKKLLDAARRTKEAEDTVRLQHEKIAALEQERMARHQQQQQQQPTQQQMDEKARLLAHGQEAWQRNSNNGFTPPGHADRIAHEMANGSVEAAQRHAAAVRAAAASANSYGQPVAAAQPPMSNPTYDKDAYERAAFERHLQERVSMMRQLYERDSGRPVYASAPTPPPSSPSPYGDPYHHHAPPSAYAPPPPPPPPSSSPAPWYEEKKKVAAAKPTNHHPPATSPYGHIIGMVPIQYDSRGMVIKASLQGFRAVKAGRGSNLTGQTLTAAKWEPTYVPSSEGVVGSSGLVRASMPMSTRWIKSSQTPLQGLAASAGGSLGAGTFTTTYCPPKEAFHPLIHERLVEILSDGGPVGDHVMHPIEWKDQLYSKGEKRRYTEH